MSIILTFFFDAEKYAQNKPNEVIVVNQLDAVGPDFSFPRHSHYDPPDRLSSGCWASGRDVGLPVGFQCNSGVGHLNIGAGRVVDQIMVRLDGMVKDGSLMRNKAVRAAIRNCKERMIHLSTSWVLSRMRVHAHSRATASPSWRRRSRAMSREYIFNSSLMVGTLLQRALRSMPGGFSPRVRKLDPSGRIIISGSLVGEILRFGP